ncbi:MAG: TolB family protein [Microthrixaceae bacterium]
MPTRPTAAPSRRRGVIGVGLAAVAALVLGAVAFAEPAPARSAQFDPTTTTTVRGAGPSTTRPPAAPPPAGPVAYATADGRVWVGTGTGAPVEVGQGAALGRGDQAAVALSPNAQWVAFLRADRSVAVVPATGGLPTVLGTDAVLTSLGRDASIAWNAGSDQVAYVAAGTPDMVPPTPPTTVPLSGPGVFRQPLPQGVVGNVVKVMSRDGNAVARIGNPSQRSYVGVVASPADDLMILSSVIPGTRQRYTLVASSFGGGETPTLLSADDPAFAPDGSYIVAVGPSKGSKELVRLDTDTLERRTLLQSESLCAPMPSPDGTRIVVASGRRCSRLSVVGATGGRVLDATPPGTTDTSTFGVGNLGWTKEGRWVTHAACRADAGRIGCGGPTLFVEPDSGRLSRGPDATTIVPVREALVKDVTLHVNVRGPVEFRATYTLDATARAQVQDTANGGKLTLQLTDGTTSMAFDLQVADGAPWVTGTVTVTDPTKDLNRTLTVLGRTGALGVRVFSVSGIWFSTDELPFETGRFNLSVRR